MVGPSQPLGFRDGKLDMSKNRRLKKEPKQIEVPEFIVDIL